MSTCDESKCVSKGYSAVIPATFTCYADGMFYPRMCADGYEPVVVEDHPIYYETNPFVAGQLALQYFTCCPPTLDTAAAAAAAATTTSNSTEIAVRRKCSDPFFPKNPDDICGDLNGYALATRGGSPEIAENQTHPVLMEPDIASKFTFFAMMRTAEDDAYMCCDELPESLNDQEDDFVEDEAVDAVSADVNFLDDLECVRYRNKYYAPALRKNILGVMSVYSCDLKDFPIAKPLFGTPETFEGPVYQCCRSGETLPPFVHDRAFKITIYTMVTICSVTVVLSGIVFVALLIPLFNPNVEVGTAGGAFRSSTLRGRLSQRLDSTRNSLKSAFSGSTRSSRRMSSQQKRNRDSIRQSVGQSVRGKGPRYCTYNLYLVYLVLADGLYFLLELILYINPIRQKFYFNFFPAMINADMIGADPMSNRISPTYLAANMWINAIICYQLVFLLKSSKMARRIRQPSIQKINRQIGLLYMCLLACGVAINFLVDGSTKAGLEGNIERSNVLLSMSYWIFALMLLPPFLYVLYASGLIWFQGYIPSLKGANPKAKAMRQLAFYFFRIIGVFFGVWVPVYVISAIALEYHAYWLIAIANWLTALQPTLSFLVILSKSDTRKYVKDLVTLKFLFDYCKNRNNADDEEEDESNFADKNDGKNKDTMQTSGTGTASGLTASGLTGSGFTGSGLSKSDLDISGIRDGEDEEEEERNDEEDDDEDLIVMSVLGFSASFRPEANRNGEDNGQA